MGDRIAKLQRKTKETDIRINFSIDGRGTSMINTGIGFFNHMLCILIDVVSRNHTAHRGKRIYIAVRTDYGTRIEHRIAAHLHIVAQHRSKFFKSCFDFFP